MMMMMIYKECNFHRNQLKHDITQEHVHASENVLKSPSYF